MNTETRDTRDIKQEYKGTNRRSEVYMLKEDAERRFTELDGKMNDTIALNVKQNQKLDGIHTDTRELLDTFTALKGAWKVLNFLGKLGKPISVAAALVALYHWGWDGIKLLLKAGN